MCLGVTSCPIAQQARKDLGNSWEIRQTELREMLELIGRKTMIRIFHGNDEEIHNDFQAWSQENVDGFHMTEKTRMVVTRRRGRSVQTVLPN
jgi:hypothetical protein